MRSCERASRLTLIERDRRLTWSERIGLTIHRMICGPCRLYRKQINTMRGVARSLGDKPATSAEPMEDDAKARIRAKLAAARQQE